MREDWIECKIGDVTFKSNKTSREKEFGEDIFEYIDISTVDNSVFKLRETKLLSWNDAPSRAQQIVDTNDVLFSTVRPYLKNIAFVSSDSNNKRIASTGFCVLKPLNITLPKFLFFYVCNDKTINAISKYQTGTSYPAVRDSDIFSINFPLPPLPEQRAIVKKLESLFSSLDAGVADLKKAQQQIKIYRQAVLKKAFEGELTKINSEWIIKKFEDCTVSHNGKRIPLNRATREKRQGEYRYYGATEIVDYIDDYIFDGQFLLIGEDGANLLSKSKPISFIVDGKFWVNNHAHIFKPNDNISIRYLNAYFNSLSLNEYVTGTAQPKLTKFNLCKIPVKLPLEISDQLLIVKQIESRLSVCDSIEQNIKESLEKAEVLRQSILKKAFEGNLLTAQELAQCKQAADYEPASVLLDRIKAEQNKATAKPSKKKVVQPLVVAKIETPLVKVSADIHAGLIAKVIKIHEENPASIDNLSHIKCEKIAHLVEYHLQIPLGRQPVKDAAGPDDYPHLKSVESRAKKAGFFNIVKKPIGYSYSLANNSDKVIGKFQATLSDEKNKQLDDLIALFLKFDLEVSEIIATTYAGWNNLILNGNANPSDEEIVYESRENWSERKLNIARERFFKAIEWMRKNEIVPMGYGAVVPFPKKKQ